MAQEKVATTQEALQDDFSFEGEDFFNFGNPEPVTKAEKVVKLVEKAKDPTEASDESGDDDEDETPDNVLDFGDDEDEVKLPPVKKPKAASAEGTDDEGDDNEDDNPDDNTSSDDDDDSDVFTALAVDLATEGIFSNPLEDGAKLTKEEFFDKFDEEVDARVEETITAWNNDMKNDPDAIAFLKFKREGGNTADFFKAYAQAPSNILPKDLDLEEDKNQKKVAKLYLTTVEGLDDSDASDRIEWLEEKGKLKENSEKWHTKMLEAEVKTKEDLVKNQAAAVKTAKENADKFRDNLQKSLSELDKVGKFTITPKDKKTLVELITKPTVKIGDNRYVSQFQAKMAEIQKSPEKLLLLAKLVTSDFDTTDLVTDINTEVVRHTKSRLVETKKKKNLSNKSPNKPRAIWEGFE